MNNPKRLYFWASTFPALIVLILSLIILIFFRFLPAKLPLFYSLPWGGQELAGHVQFLILPAVLAVITLLNLVLSFQLHESQSFFKKVLMAATILSALILVMTFAQVVLMFI